jgi:glyoxylase-like metal-dependent hydrolase (beta-lactamase superfamily II)
MTKGSRIRTPAPWCHDLIAVEGIDKEASGIEAGPCTSAGIPPRSRGPVVNPLGYYMGRVEGNLYWVTDGTYQSAFVTTLDGVVLLDAPPSIGHNLQRAVNEIAAAHRVSNRVTHLIYSHHHADHIGASSLFGRDISRIGHENTRQLLLRDDDPARPPPEHTFAAHETLELGGERIDLAWHGPNHTSDNIFIHLPDHDTLMLVDIVSPGWAPACHGSLAEDVPGYVEALGTVLTYRFKHFIGGHMGRLGTRADVALHRQYIADIAESCRAALDTVDPSPYLASGHEDPWSASRAYLEAAAAVAAAPVIEKYSDVLAAADVSTASTTFHVMQSMRVDLGYASRVHP